MGKFVMPIIGVALVLGVTAVAMALLPPPPGSAVSLAPLPPASAASSSAAAGELSSFASGLNGHLVVLDQRTLTNFDAEKLRGVKYWAFYCSASWCPPCRAFTPKLVDFYKSFKPTHPNFELVFVNLDQDEDGMMAYMIGDGMTWPAVRFTDRRNSYLGIDKYFGQYIPDLVLVDNNGNVLSDTNRNGSYIGPETVMDEIPRLVPAP